MSIPQDTRGPFRQQRWLKTENQDAADLSPNSAAEVTGATHIAPGETASGSTELNIEKPSGEIKLGCILGTGLQTSKSGYDSHGTMDFPAYLQYNANDGTPANGEIWGPVAGSTALSKGQPGFVCLGDADATRGVARFNRDFPKGVIRFQLTATLHLAGTAAALLLNEDWTSAGVAITVRDPFTNPGCWMGYSGYQGWAVPGAGGYFDVLWMERPALVIYFTLTQDTNTTSGTTATWTNYFQQGDKQVAASGLVYDVQALYPRAKNGAKGVAVWNDRTERYEVVVCQQMGTLFYASCDTFCPSDSTVGITYLGHYQHSLFNQDPNPAPTVASNFYGLAGRSGDMVLIVYDDVNNVYDIAQVTPHLLKNPTYYRIVCAGDGSSAKLQARGDKWYAYNCNETYDWEDVSDGFGTVFDAVNNLVVGNPVLLGFTQVLVLCTGDSHTENLPTDTCSSSSSGSV